MVQLSPTRSSKRNSTSLPSSPSKNARPSDTGKKTSFSAPAVPRNAVKRTRSNNSLSSNNTATSRGGSINKTLTSLRSTAENRSCADCRAALVDPSNVYASFCPSDTFASANDDASSSRRQISSSSGRRKGSSSSNNDNNTFQRIVGISLHDFQFTHRAFAPPDAASATSTTRDDEDENEIHSSQSHSHSNRSIPRKKIRKDEQDIGIHANERFGGFGVFICGGCAEAHRQLGTNVTTVLPVIDLSGWTAESVDWMAQSGGNARCWRVYEAYVTDTWKQRRPISSSTMSERLVFCRAKYEALAFCLPPPGPLAEPAWQSILEHNALGKQYANSVDLKNIINLSASCSINGKGKFSSQTGSKSSLPNRLVDHFCVVSSSMQILPKQVKKDLSKLTSPEELCFWPHVSDCYPERDAHSDMEFPEHLPSFVMPKGCHPVSQPKPPCFYSFVLTMADGERLYGGALQIYDEHYDIDDLREAIEDSEYTGDLPAFLKETADDADDASSDVWFLPKCLVMLSHHAFFDLFRSVLLELYQISLMAAPLPIERYIANFVREVPLPPKGRVKVEFAFTTGRKFTVQRPPINKLPMTNFPFRPLFASLSVSNIIVVLASLMEERKVVFLSHHCSILTPVAEAMVSALFPFQWVGLYIPLVPLSMLDILDAPVPYLVGIDADYFQRVPVEHRPKDAVFVDIDRDVVHMGGLEIPKVPSRDAEKLLIALEEAGGSCYLVPNSGIKGCIMAGTETSMLVPNEDRPRYAQMTTMKALEAKLLGRQEVFSMTDLAYGGSGGNTVSISGFGTEDGQMTMTADEMLVKEKKGNKVFGVKPIKKPKFMRNKRAEILSKSESAKSHGHLLDIAEAGGISIDGIRSAFLRFTVTLFTEYEDFVSPATSRRFFNDKKLMADLGLESGSTLFLQNVVQTQFFQHFLEERKSNPESHEIRFFEESIIAKINRSKKATMANGGKKRPTPFLKDESWKVTKTYTPPPPSNLGLPESNDTYTYGTFPSLDPSRFGRIRHPTIWRQNDSTRFKFAKKSSKVAKTERDIVKMALRPIIAAPSAAMAAAARSARDLDSALMAVSVATGLREKKVDDLSAEEWKKSAVEKRNVNTLSKAEMIMINARRKNIILLDCIIKAQAICRGYLARCQFKDTNDSERVHSKFKSVHKENQLEKARRRRAERQQKLWTEKATVVQSIVRMYISKVERRRRLSAILTIQRYQRASVSRRRWLKMKSAAITIQTNVRCRRISMTYSEIRRLVVRVQARTRAICIRVRLSFVMSEKMAMYRTQIFVLWAYVHLPLAVRTKMWPDLHSCHSFLRLRLAESELCRLWSMAGYNSNKHDESVNDIVATRSESIGLDASVYRRCKECVDWIKSEMNLQSSPPAITDALKGEEVERLQIYERLTASVPDRELSKIYPRFEIPANEKLKKVALAKKIWTNISQVDHSVSTMMLLFPELKNSLGINFHTPSAKGQRRFPNASKLPLPSLDQNLWNEISVEGNVKNHVQEVAILYMTRMPAVWKKFGQNPSSIVSKFPASYQQAIKEVYKTSDWKIARRIVIRRYLNGRHVHKANPNVEVVLAEGPIREMIYASLQQTPSDYQNPFDDSPTKSDSPRFDVFSADEKKAD